MSQKNINNGLIKEDYSDIKAYVIHFDSNSSASTPGATYATAINTDGSLSINDSAKSTNNGAVSLGEIPEGAVCRTYPEKAVGNWMYVEYKGVQGYAYNNYLQSVSRTVSDGKKAEHPHMSYNLLPLLVLPWQIMVMLRREISIKFYREKE